MTTRFYFAIILLNRMQMSSKRYVSILIALLIIGASFFAGIFIGKDRSISNTDDVTILENKDAIIRETVDFAPFWRAWNTLDEKFVSSVATTSTTTALENDTQKRVWGAIKGMVESLGDPYTTFFPPAE